MKRRTFFQVVMLIVVFLFQNQRRFLPVIEYRQFNSFGAMIIDIQRAVVSGGVGVFSIDELPKFIGFTASDGTIRWQIKISRLLVARACIVPDFILENILSVSGRCDIARRLTQGEKLI